MDEIEETKQGLDDAEDARQAALAAALQASSGLFYYHFDSLKRLIKFKERAGASLYWGSMKTVFRGLPVYDAALDDLLPEIKALPSEAPKAGAAAPKAASRGRPKS